MSPQVKTTPVKPFSESRCEFKDASLILAGVPLDATSSFRCGTRFAPAHVREISWHLEDYSFAENRSILDSSFFDAGDLLLKGDLENNLQEIEEFAKQTFEKGKRLLVLGGEHLVTYPVVKALSKIHRDLHVVVFDAHTDMGDACGERKLSHAGVMKLVRDLLGPGRIFMFGVRSGTREDRDFPGGGVSFSAREPGEEVIEKLARVPVYISVDVDVLDPSVAPGVATPELLGWSYDALDGALGKLAAMPGILGADVVEICPPFDPAGVTSLIGAGLVRKLIFAMTMDR